MAKAKRNEKGQFVKGHPSHNRADLIGEKFGRLEVLERAGKDKHQNLLWLCRCECGNTTTVSSNSLQQGRIKSCGCLRKERAREATLKHGEFTNYNTEKPRLYRIWIAMRTRCNNPNFPAYHNYGGRGISICDEWEKYENFRDWAKNNGYEDDLTIHRVDNDGDYYPENCKWVTRREQANNMRVNHLITFNGETKTMAEWSRETGINYQTLADRINHQNLEPKEALTKPIGG